MHFYYLLPERVVQAWFYMKSFCIFLYYLLPERVVKCINKLKVELLESHTVEEKLQVFGQIIKWQKLILWILFW